jgi:hypothetical protein
LNLTQYSTSRALQADPCFHLAAGAPTCAHVEHDLFDQRDPTLAEESLP